MTYDDWLEPPVPVYFSVWVFDLINPLEVVEFGEKPFVLQRGPYVYRYDNTLECVLMKDLHKSMI